MTDYKNDIIDKYLYCEVYDLQNLCENKLFHTPGIV